MPVMHRSDDLVQQALEFVEIHHHAHRIELFGADAHDDVPVMAVQRLECAIAEAELVGCGEIPRDGDLEWHGSVMLTDGV